MQERRNGRFCVRAKIAKWVKNPFFAKKKFKNGKRLMFIWENGTFLFSQLFTLMAGTDIRIFAQKSFLFNGTPFFSKDHRRAWTWAPHRRWTRPKIFFCFRFRPFFVIFAKKSYPTPLWPMGFCLSVPSLRLQRTGPSAWISVNQGRVPKKNP